MKACDILKGKLKASDVLKAGAPVGNRNAAGPHKRFAEYKQNEKEEIESTIKDAQKDSGFFSASDASPSDAIRARSASDVIYAGATAQFPVTASSKPWATGEPVEFMYMPAGKHTICAGFRSASIKLTVDVDPSDAARVLQGSLEQLRASQPKQMPFGCVEHEEKDASVWAKGFTAKEDGVYLCAEPSELGARHVNGRIHRSWSPSFLTDADYSKAKLEDGTYVFPEGVRGSESNPAKITGCAFCLGTLTNKPAFREMSPVKAREATVKAAEPEASAPQPFDASALLDVARALRVAHWNADTKGTEHEALGELYDSWEDGMDQLVEALCGKRGCKVAEEALGNSELAEQALAALAGVKVGLDCEADADLCNIVADMANSVNKGRYLLKAKETQDMTVSEVLKASKGGQPGNQNAAGPHEFHAYKQAIIEKHASLSTKDLEKLHESLSREAGAAYAKHHAGKLPGLSDLHPEYLEADRKRFHAAIALGERNDRSDNVDAFDASHSRAIQAKDVLKAGAPMGNRNAAGPHNRAVAPRHVLYNEAVQKTVAARIATENAETSEDHEVAAAAHMAAAEAHAKSAELNPKEADYHKSRIEEHERQGASHMEKVKASDKTMTAKDVLKAARGGQPGNQNAAGPHKFLEHTSRDPLFGRHGYKVKYKSGVERHFTEGELRPVKSKSLNASDKTSSFSVRAVTAADILRHSAPSGATAQPGGK